MSETKWTPGPWKFRESVGDGGGLLRQIETADDIIVFHVFDDDNARLISAAPDMAEALAQSEAVLTALAMMTSPDRTLIVDDDRLKAALISTRAALAKARGEA